MRTNRWAGALASLLLASCASYGAPDEVLYGTAVFTQPQPGFDFAPLGTYYLDPTYTEVDGEDLSDRTLPSNVAAAIDAGMTGYGWTAATIDAADVGIRVTVLKGDVSVYYPGGWCDYWYYYSCYYGWYYAGSYNVGTMILEMGDLSTYEPNPPDPTRLSVVWTSLLYGVASTGAVDTARAATGVNQAFAQSPYLRTN